MAGYCDYHSTIARAISDLPGKTEEARGAVYELARTALQKRLSAFDPPLSETDLAIEQFALEAAIQRVETESRPSHMRHGLSPTSTLMKIVRSVQEKFNNNIAIRGDSLKPAIGAGLAQGLEFIQRKRLTATSQRFFNIFGSRPWITEYPQIRIAVRLLVAALVGIFGGIFVYWMTAENNRAANSHSLISPSELTFSDVTLSHPDSHSAGGWEVKGAIKNNSPRTVAGFWLKVTVRDCDYACVTIGEEIKRIVINIPPSQTHLIDEVNLFTSEMFIPKNWNGVTRLLRLTQVNDD